MRLSNLHQGSFIALLVARTTATPLVDRSLASPATSDPIGPFSVINRNGTTIGITYSRDECGLIAIKSEKGTIHVSDQDTLAGCGLDSRASEPQFNVYSDSCCDDFQAGVFLSDPDNETCMNSPSGFHSVVWVYNSQSAPDTTISLSMYAASGCPIGTDFLGSDTSIQNGNGQPGCQLRCWGSPETVQSWVTRSNIG